MNTLDWILIIVTLLALYRCGQLQEELKKSQLFHRLRRESDNLQSRKPT